MKTAFDRSWWLRKSVEPQINTGSEKRLATASAQQRVSTQGADVQRSPDVGAKSQNMCAFKMYTVCYARLITKTEAVFDSDGINKNNFHWRQAFRQPRSSCWRRQHHSHGVHRAIREGKEHPRVRRHQQATTTSPSLCWWPRTKATLQSIDCGSHPNKVTETCVSVF